MNTVIIGAGITGLSAAFHLKKDYIVLEKESKPGGLCRSINCGDFIFDYTGHSIHLRNDYTKRLIFNLLRGNLEQRKRDSWIYSHKVYTRYPFQANLYGLPVNVIKECILGLLRAKMSPDTQESNDSYIEGVTLRQWVLKKFGKGFGKHFFFPYNKKLWTVGPDTLTTEWVAPFVPQPEIEEVINGAFSDQKKCYGYNSTFYYPGCGGIQSLPDALAKKIGNLHLNSAVKEIDWRKKTVYYNDKKVFYEYLIPTIPLPELLYLLKDLPGDISAAAAKLSWNSVYCINLGIGRPDIQKKKHWIYFPEKDKIFYRAGFYHNFSKQLTPKNSSSFYVEVSHKNKQKLNKKLILDNTIKGLRGCEILNKTDRIKEVNIIDIPCAYVIYDRNRSSSLNVIKCFLNQNKIFSIGRYGAWKYSYIEESILDGKSTAELINSNG